MLRQNSCTQGRHGRLKRWPFRVWYFPVKWFFDTKCVIYSTADCFFHWIFLSHCFYISHNRIQLLHFTGFFVPDCSTFSEQASNFSFLFTKIDHLNNWKQIMKTGPEFHVLNFPHVRICSASACPQHGAGREDGSLEKDSIPLTEWTKILLATCWHLLKMLSMLSTTVLSITYTCKTWSTSQVSGSRCSTVPLAELKRRYYLLISLPSAALSVLAVGDL